MRAGGLDEPGFTQTGHPPWSFWHGIPPLQERLSVGGITTHVVVPLRSGYASLNLIDTVTRLTETSTTLAKHWALAHPRHWPTWMALALLWGVTQLPRPAGVAIANAMGSLYFLLSRRRRRITEVNLTLCFPDCAPDARRQLARAHLQAFAYGLIELGIAWWRPDRALPPHRITGLEHLRAALERGRGALLLNAHFTTIELTGRFLTQHHPYATLYRRNENQVIESVMAGKRKRRCSDALHRDDMRALLRALRRNIAVWYAPDQSYKGRLSLLVPFFGVPAATNSATAKIAKISGAPVLPFFGWRRPDGRYELEIRPPLEDFPSGDDHADTLRVNQLIEEAIRVAPEQYLWLHRRFKKRPGLADPY